MKTVPVILAGGVGERFWPLSRSCRPKQLLPLISSRPMIEETLVRVRSFTRPPVVPLLITGKTIAGPLRALTGNRIPCRIIAEPRGKNTAPAIAFAAMYLQHTYDECTMLVLPADHAIAPVQKFTAAVRYAARLAQQHDALVVFGITPGRPDTGYGYIESGKKVGTEKNIRGYTVKRFIEKPDLKKARDYCAKGNFFWNSGMFVWKTGVILAEFERSMPDLYRQVCAVRDKGFTKAAIDFFYRSCVKESVDYGIMEKARNVLMVSGAFNWDDVGSWDAVGRIHPANRRRTTVTGTRIYEADCTGSIIVNDSSRHVAAIGLDNIVLVTTEDAVLALPRSEVQNIKKHLGEMKKNNLFPAGLF